MYFWPASIIKKLRSNRPSFLQIISIKISQNKYICFKIYLIRHKLSSNIKATFLWKAQIQALAKKKYGYLLMQRAEMNLSEYIKSKFSRKNKLSLEQVTAIISTLLSGFSYLQSLNIAHCDIKPENILLVNSANLIFKICDVGSCKSIQKSNKNQQNNLNSAYLNDGWNQITIKGTLSFLAPQLIKTQDTKITSINAFRSDVYSFGLVLIYIIIGKKFSYQERKQIKQEIYFQIIDQWIEQVKEAVSEQQHITEVLKKALEIDIYKRPLFKELKILFQSFWRKRKVLRQNKLKKIQRTSTQQQSIQSKRQGLEISYKTRLPQIKESSSSTLISFHSKQRLTGKISTGNLKNTINSIKNKSNDKSKKSNQKSRQKNSPLQKTTMYSTFSIDKSKISIQIERKKIVHITQQNYCFINYESMIQEQKIFLLFYPNIQFEKALSVVINRQCNTEVFGKLSHVKRATNLYLEYQGVDIYGVDENTPTIQNFDNIYINLQDSLIQGGYNSLLRCLCPISLKSINMQLTGSEITYQQIGQQLERLKNKEIAKLQICWDKAFLNSQQFTAINQKLSKLPLKKLALSLSTMFLKTNQKARWPLPQKCKILYLNFSNNFLSETMGSLSISLLNLAQLKQLYINLENNNLNDTDIKVLIRSIKDLKNLEKAILIFSLNPILKPVYCFQQLSSLHKISSLELRISKCNIPFQQFQQIYSSLTQLFNQNLKILKISYDRKISKSSLLGELENCPKQNNLKVDILGYDCKQYMIYVKRKSQPAAQKNLRIRIKQSSLKTNLNKKLSTNAADTSVNSNKTIPYPLNSAKTKNKQQQSDEYSTLSNLKSINTGKGTSNIYKQQNQRVCSTLYTTYPTYECYICLGCAELKQSAKYEYFCRACIQNCEHKGHHIVRTYQKKVCNCPFNSKCHFKQLNNDLICADKLGISYKKEYQCQKCFPYKSICEGCVLECDEGHSEWVQKRTASCFVCQNCETKQNYLNYGKKPNLN